MSSYIEYDLFHKCNCLKCVKEQMESQIARNRQRMKMEMERYVWENEQREKKEEQREKKEKQEKQKIRGNRKINAPISPKIGSKHWNN